MLWLTWRQHRWQLIGITLLMAAYWAYLLYAGIRAHQALEGCPSIYRDAPVPPSCFLASNTVNGVGNSMSVVTLFGNLLPLAAGMFWGAPLIAREIEQGTFRLAFTQSVSQHRWLYVKLAVLAIAAAVLGAITGAVVTWSLAGFAPMFPTQPFGDAVTFSQAGAVPAATWVFAMVTGATVGLLLRRTTMAMAVTLVALPLVFTALVFARPHYLPPVESVVDSAHMLEDSPDSANARGWVLHVSYVDRTGRELDSRAAGAACPDGQGSVPTAQCLDRTGIRQRLVHHPASRYRWFQLIEMGLLLGASSIMALTLRRRITDHLA